jgi:hypothetical protein
VPSRHLTIWKVPSSGLREGCARSTSQASRCCSKHVESNASRCYVGKADALLVGSDPVFDVHRGKLVALVAAIAIPAIYQFRDFTAAVD